MKFCLISVILPLVMLAASSLASPISKTFTTILYDEGFVNVEGFDLETFSYDYHMFGLRFGVKPRSKNGSVTVEDFIDFTQAVQRSSFALDFFKQTPGDRTRHGEFCKSYSTGFIQDCVGKIELRMLTREEYQKLQKLKEEFKNSGKLYELVYNRKKIQIISEHYFAGLDVEIGENRLLIDTDNRPLRKDFRSFMEVRAKNGKLADTAFVIENGRSTECKKSDLPDLETHRCFRNVSLRGFDPDLDA